MSKQHRWDSEEARKAGKKSKRRSREAIFGDCFKVEDIQKIAAKMLEQALAGEWKQQEYILNRYLGKLKETVDVNSPIEINFTGNAGDIIRRAARIATQDSEPEEEV
jgi:hypothetical protein